MAYLVLARKWRPQTFDEVVGQRPVTQTLKNALAQDRLAHALLFAGPRGVGKTTTARILAKALNCERGVAPEPCNACPSCTEIAEGRSMDCIEIDGASNRGIDEVRELRENVRYAPAAGKSKVVIIDEVHMLTEPAFNALLKTLEEPPPHVVFILATTEAHRLPATIASRCQRFDFRRAPLAALVANLQRICEGEGLTCPPQALELIARSATGSHRDAVNLLDQLATSYGGDLTLEHVRTGLGLIGDERAGRLALLALSGDLAGGLTLIASVRDDGLDLRQFQRELVAELRALLLVKSGVEPPEGVTAERLAELRAAVAGVETSRVLAALRAFGEADLKTDPNSTLPLDIALAECILAAEQAAAQRDETVRPSEAISAARPARDGAAGPSLRAGTPAQRSATPSPARGDSPSAAPRTAEPVAPAGEAPRVAAEVAGPRPATLESLQASMRVIYQMARERSPQLGALLNSGCDIIEVDGRQVLIGFRHAVHAEKAAEQRNLEGLRGIILQLTQQEMSVVCRVQPDVEDWKQREAASRSPLVRAAQQMGARLVSSAEEQA